MPMQRAAETRRGDEDELVVALLSTPIFELVDETACEPIDTFFHHRRARLDCMTNAAGAFVDARQAISRYSVNPRFGIVEASDFDQFLSA